MAEDVSRKRPRDARRDPSYYRSYMYADFIYCSSVLDPSRADDVPNPDIRGFTMLALDSLGLLDTGTNDPLCPGGCYPTSSVWMAALKHIVGGLGTGVWTVDTITVYIDNLKLSMEKTTLIGGTMKGVRHIKKRYASNTVTILIPLSVYDRRPKNKLEWDTIEGHANLIIGRAHLDTNTLDVMIYDPWDSDSEGALLRTEKTAALTGMIADAMVVGAEEFGMKLELSKVGTDVGDRMFSTRGIQYYEDPLLGEYQQVMDDRIWKRRRGAFAKALQGVAKTLGIKYNGYCATWSYIMMVLAIMYPNKDPQRFDSDMVGVFLGAYTSSNRGEGDMSFLEKHPEMTKLVPVLRQGASAMARVVGLSAYNLIKLTGKKPICCVPGNE